MVNDPLAAFRRGPAIPDQTSESPAETIDDGEYRAFHAVDRGQKSLSIRAMGTAWVRAVYSFLQYIAEDAGRGRMFYIVYGFMVVEVRGRNLIPVVNAIDSGNCVFIQQFDSGAWKKPKDTSAPFIESIQFHHGAEKRGEILTGKQKEHKAEEA